MKTITKQLLVDSCRSEYSNKLILSSVLLIIALVVSLLKTKFVLIIVAILLVFLVFECFLFHSNIKKIKSGKFHIIEEELVYLHIKEQHIKKAYRFRYSNYYYYTFEFFNGNEYTVFLDDDKKEKNSREKEELINNSRPGEKFYLVMIKSTFSKKGKIIKVFNSNIYKMSETDFILENGKYLCRKNF